MSSDSIKTEVGVLRWSSAQPDMQRMGRFMRNSGNIIVTNESIATVARAARSSRGQPFCIKEGCTLASALSELLFYRSLLGVVAEASSEKLWSES